jgi:hypothetical protein
MTKLRITFIEMDDLQRQVITSARTSNMYQTMTIQVDCSQFTEFKVELAGYISEKLEGNAVALVQGADIAIDWLSDSQYRGPALIISIIQSFLAAKNLSR